MKLKPFKDEMCLFYIRTQFVPRSKHSPPRLCKTNVLMLYKPKVAVCSKIYTKFVTAYLTFFKQPNVRLIMPYICDAYEAVLGMQATAITCSEQFN